MEFYVLAAPQGQQNITQSYNGRIASLSVCARVCVACAT